MKELHVKEVISKIWKKSTIKEKIVAMDSLAIITFLAVLIVKNWENNAKFWEASFSSCLGIAVVIVLSYSLTQIKNDRRKQKDILENVAVDIQHLICDKSSYIFKDPIDSAEISLRIRHLDNLICALEAHKMTYKYEKELNEITKCFDEYATVVGDNYENLGQISVKQLQRPLFQIERVLYDIRLKLYN